MGGSNFYSFTFGKILGYTYYGPASATNVGSDIIYYAYAILFIRPYNSSYMGGYFV